MVKGSEYKSLAERSGQMDYPLLALAIWVVVLGVAGLVYAYMAPDRSAALYGLGGAAVGAAIGGFAEFSESALAGILRAPGRWVFQLIAILRGI